MMTHPLATPSSFSSLAKDTLRPDGWGQCLQFVQEMFIVFWWCCLQAVSYSVLSEHSWCYCSLDCSPSWPILTTWCAGTASYMHAPFVHRHNKALSSLTPLPTNCRASASLCWVPRPGKHGRLLTHVARVKGWGWLYLGGRMHFGTCMGWQMVVCM